jgi:hypothetical protein
MKRRKPRRIVFSNNFGNCSDLRSIANPIARQQPQDADPRRRRVYQAVAIFDPLERVRLQRPMDSLFDLTCHIVNSVNP